MLLRKLRRKTNWTASSHPGRKLTRKLAFRCGATSKAREAMIAAVHTFNSGGLTFRAELFIVTAIIAWTYLLHAWFKREGIDYRHTKKDGGQKVVAKTSSGADQYWELSQCLKYARCPSAAAQ
jgi:hypothetical protein